MADASKKRSRRSTGAKAPRAKRPPQPGAEDAATEQAAGAPDTHDASQPNQPAPADAAAPKPEQATVGLGVVRPGEGATGINGDLLGRLMQTSTFRQRVIAKIVDRLG